MNVANLEPYIVLSERLGRRRNDVPEALQKVSIFDQVLLFGNYSITYFQTVDKLRLLLVDYTQPEVNLIGLIKVRLDLHNLGKGLLGIVVTSITIIQYANSIPKHRILPKVSNESWYIESIKAYLGITQVYQRVLIGIVCLLEVLRHEEAMPCHRG